MSASIRPDYGVDLEHLREYTDHSVDPRRFPRYLKRYVYGAQTQEAYLEKVGGVRKLLQLRRGGLAALYR